MGCFIRLPKRSFNTVPVKALAVVLALAMSLSFFTFLSVGAVDPESGFAGGDGSAGNPYQIANATQLELMTELINGDSAASYNTKHYIQTADIVMPAVAAGQSNHEPIGSNGNYYFRGSFDGQNHSISGVKIDRPSEQDQGLFSVVYSGAVVKNVHLINSNISARAWSGGIAYYNSGTLENCTYAGILKGGISSGDYAGTCIGGIAGVNHGIIDKCINYSTITTGVSENVNQSNGCGGIAGNNFGTIRNCYNSGNITTPVGSSMIGGIVGDNRRGNIYNSYNTGTINAAGSVGGIAGFNYGQVQNNYNVATLSSAPKPSIVGGGVRLGGIVGGNYINSTAYGTVKYDYWLNNSLKGIGTAEGVYSNCASFLNTSGALTTASGHTIIEGKTTLIDALNAWTAAENNKTGTTTYMYWKSSGGYPVFTPAYRIMINSGIQNGSMTVNKTAAEGQTVTLAPAPAAGYRLIPGTVSATYNGDTECTLTAGENNTYTFTMPAFAVTVSAEYEAIPATAPTISVQPPAETTTPYGSSTSLSLEADVFDGGTLSYQWYKGESSDDTAPDDSKKAGTGNPYSTSTALDVGNHYYFCVVKNSLSNGQTQSTVSSVATVTVIKATPSLGSVSASGVFVGEELSASNLSRTNETVAGVLAWEENPSFDSLSEGEKSATYSFTPTGVDADRYNALTGQSVAVSVNKRNILSVSPQDAISDKSFGTAQEDLDLPATVTVTVQGTTGNVTRTVPVIWTGYNPNTLDTQTLTGTIDLTDNIELLNSDSRSASISVTLQPLTPKSISNVSAKIKVGFTDGTDVLKALVTEQFDESVDLLATNAAGWTGFPINYNTATIGAQTVTVRVRFKYGYEPEYRDVDIVYEIVNPETLSYTVTTVPTIDATDEDNASTTALLSYVNGYNVLTATWDAEAVGMTMAANSAPDYTTLPKAYAPTGTDYAFSQTYLGHTISQNLTVNEVKQDAPVLEVDFSTETVDTTTAMAYSVQEDVWNTCADNMSFSPWLGKTIGFKTTASGFKVDSETVEIAFSAREQSPMSLAATINDEKTEITILGLESDTAYEYSTDGTTYYNLSADGKITVLDYQPTIGVRKKHVVGVSVHSQPASVAVKYTMTFVTGTDSTILPSYAVSGGAIEEPMPPVRSGYSFDGWYLSEAGEGGAISFPYTLTSNITVYALWDLNQSDDSWGTYIAFITVNGKTQSAATSQTTMAEGRTVTTVMIDSEKLNEILRQSGNNTTVIIPVTNGSDVAVGVLTAQMIKNMQEKEAVLQITTGTASYILPVSEINIDAVSQELGEQIQLSDIKVSISVAKPTADTVSIIEDTANKNNYKLVVPSVEFNITCTCGDKTVELSSFSGYVERMIALPDGIDPSKITTGIVLNKDGTFSHVPTTIVVIDGRYYAKIRSLTNSTYSVIYNPIKFNDVTKHWAKNAINDLGSRLVVSGVGKGNYNPDSDITRAEFAAIVVRAFGLPADLGENRFSDVKTSDWYCGYVKTAYSYGIITGYTDGTLRPKDKITREQAMTMISRAMKLTGLSSQPTENEINTVLGEYSDSANVSNFAKLGIAECLKAGIINGKGDSSTVAPKDYITRAEVAAIVQRLLQKSELI